MLVAHHIHLVAFVSGKHVLLILVLNNFIWLILVHHALLKDGSHWVVALTLVELIQDVLLVDEVIVSHLLRIHVIEGLLGHLELILEVVLGIH